MSGLNYLYLQIRLKTPLFDIIKPIKTKAVKSFICPLGKKPVVSKPVSYSKSQKPSLF